MALAAGACAHTASPRACVERTAQAVSNLMTEVVKLHVVYESADDAAAALENNLSRTGAVYGTVLLPSGKRLASWNPGGVNEPTLDEVQEESIIVRGGLLFSISPVYDIRDSAAREDRTPEAIGWVVAGFSL
jgi:hypothetical protein